MDTIPLPPRPDLDQYRKRAKALVTAANSENSNAVTDWAREWLSSLTKLLEVPITPFVQSSIDRAIVDIDERSRKRPFALADAQHLIADAHGFANWTAFAEHVENASGKRERTDDFERAADAVVNGDLATLRTLLHDVPDLIRARSRRVHRVTLLHYVAANGVEDFRQKTPPNAVEIARLLLESGAEVDAVADTYEGGWWETTMNLLVSSTHPHGAGLQSALVDVLVDFGAAVDGTHNDGSPLFTALYFGYIDAAETLVRRGASLGNVVAAAAMGRLDLVRQFVVDARTLRPGVPLVAPPWAHLPDDPKAHIEYAMAWAAKFARDDVVKFLLELGVDVAARDGYKMTALHWAAANGRVDTVRALLDRGAPLEVQNMWEGTILSSTAHFAIHAPVKGVDYPAVMEMLIAAGADPRAAYPSGDEKVDAILRRHGAGT